MAKIFSDLSLNNLSIEPSIRSTEALMINDIPLFKKVENEWKINEIFIHDRGAVTKTEEKSEGNLKEIIINYKSISFEKKDLIECSCSVYYSEESSNEYEYYLYCHDTFSYDLENQETFYGDLLTRVNILNGRQTHNKVIIIPHYVGFGVSANLKRAYFMKYNAESILDALIATNNYFKSKSLNMSKKVNIAGFSHGAYQSLYVHSLIDSNTDFEVVSNKVIAGIFDNSMFNLTDNVFNMYPYGNSFNFDFVRLAWNSGISYSKWIDDYYKNDLTKVFKTDVKHESLVDYFESNKNEKTFKTEYLSLNDVFTEEFIEYVQNNNDLQKFISNQNINGDIFFKNKSIIEFIFGDDDTLAPLLLSKNIIDTTFPNSTVTRIQPNSTHSELYYQLPTILNMI